MMTQATGATLYPDPEHEAHSLTPDDVTLLIPDDDTLTVSNDDTTKLISDSGISEKPTPSHTRTGERRIYLSATWPFILHVVTVLTLVTTLLTYIDGHNFNLESRSNLSGTTPLQSDITTAISAGVTIYRLFATMWSGAMLWRCIFILLANDGISLEQIDRLLTWQIHIPSRLLSSQVLISIILLAALPMQLSGPILTGSITWSPSHCLAEGQSVTGIPGGFPEEYQSTTPGPDGLIPPAIAFSVDNTLTSGFASTAWLNSLEDERTMKRVIDSIAHLPINSTLKNVTLPYFAVKKLEWIKDPVKEFPREVAVPKYFAPGVFALIPDGNWSDFFGASSYSASIISETRIIIGYYGDYQPNSTCTSSYRFGDLPANIGFKVEDRSCLIYGRVTYEAGAAECRECRVSSRVTVQNDTALTVLPSPETRGAADMMPMVGGMMATQNNSLPRAYNNLDRYATELLIRSYAASWTYLRKSTDRFISDSLSSDVRIAIPTSSAKVSRWRVWVWLSLNLLFTLSGVLFLVVQRLSGQKLVGNPQLAVLLLDTSEALHKKDRAFCDFSTLADDDKVIGNLRFRRNWDQGGHRQVGFDEE